MLQNYNAKSTCNPYFENWNNWKSFKISLIWTFYYKIPEVSFLKALKLVKTLVLHTSKDPYLWIYVILCFEKVLGCLEDIFLLQICVCARVKGVFWI